MLRPLVAPSLRSGATAQGLQVINSVDPCVLKSNYYLSYDNKHAPSCYLCTIVLTTAKVTVYYITLLAYSIRLVSMMHFNSKATPTTNTTTAAL